MMAGVLTFIVLLMFVLGLSLWLDLQERKRKDGMVSKAKICPHGILMTEECRRCERKKGGDA